MSSTKDISHNPPVQEKPTEPAYSSSDELPSKHQQRIGRDKWALFVMGYFREAARRPSRFYHHNTTDQFRADIRYYVEILRTRLADMFLKDYDSWEVRQATADILNAVCDKTTAKLFRTPTGPSQGTFSQRPYYKLHNLNTNPMPVLNCIVYPLKDLRKQHPNHVKPLLKAEVKKLLAEPANT